METFDESLLQSEANALRESIKNKYRQYQAFNRGRFPELDYNTNRVNYIPLRESFEEEFYVIRGIDRSSPNIHIPSTNTLALLFTDDTYIPGKKILNTCRSYAEGKSGATNISGELSPIHPEQAVTRKSKWLVMAGLVLSTCLVFTATQWFFKPVASGLVFDRPTDRSVVQQELIVEGKVANAETVWLVVRPEKSALYWVQPPVKVQDNGRWIGVIYIGGVSYEDAGLIYQVRAFVNPAKKLVSGVMLKNWPQSELGSDTLKVVKGSKPN